MFTMPKEGCLLIADISGFTSYLQESELEHAQGTLTALLDLLVKQIHSPLEVVDLEGDAVFSYAPEVTIDQGQALADMVEDAYLAFREALNTMVLNTTCTCTACRLIPTLDLKQFVHYGTFVPQQVAGQIRLVGHDVNVVHRLLKNSVTEATGFQAYTAFTRQAVEALRLENVLASASPHTESYGDMGTIKLQVVDMHRVWERKRERVRVRVSSDEAFHNFSAEFSIGSDELWQYITDPEFRTMFHQADDQHIERRPDGELGPGGVYVCAHGKHVSKHLILDWDPPRSYTVNMVYSLAQSSGLVTYLIEPADTGSRLRVRFAPIQSPLRYRPLFALIMRLFVPRDFRNGVNEMREAIQADRGNVPTEE